MCYVSQNIVAITGTLRLNRLTLLCQEPTSLQASSPIWASEEPEWWSLFANKIEAMYERLHVSVRVEPRSTSGLILPLFYLRD